MILEVRPFVNPKYALSTRGVLYRLLRRECWGPVGGGGVVANEAQLQAGNDFPGLRVRASTARARPGMSSTKAERQAEV